MTGAYIHIPFCKTRCIYCDFYSTTRSELKQQYIRALCTELKTRKGYLKEEPIETIYFGGGTPSQLAHEDFEQIFRTIKEVYGTEHAMVCLWIFVAKIVFWQENISVFGTFNVIWK